MSYLSLNSSSLQQAHPSLFDRLSQIEEEKEPFDIIAAASGDLTARLEGKYLHSSRDPVKEASKIMTSHLNPGVSTCIIEGFALGYYAEEALRFSDSLHIIIADPSLSRFKKALEARDLSSMLMSSRISFLIEEKTEKIAALLRKSSPGEIAVVRNRTLFMADSSFYREIEGYISRYKARKQVNEATLKRFGQIWIRNLIYNMTVLSESGNLQELENLFSPIPVLLLAAGPSLSPILPHLKTLRERVILVAVDTASEALLRQGIDPDFLVVIDPQYWNTRHLDRIDMKNTILISESSTYPSVFRKNHGILYLSGSLFPLGQFIETFIGHRKRLGAGGSVSTSAWDFCHLISSGPVYCAGLDLGFPDNETHYKGSFFEERTHILSSRMNSAELQAFTALYNAHPFPEKNNTDGTTLTDQRLVVYKQWFEERLEQSPERTTFNLSPRGIKIEGIPFVPLETLFRLPLKRKEIDALLEKRSPPSRENRTAAVQALLRGVKILMKELEKLQALTERGIHLIDTREEEPEKLSYRETVLQLDAVDREILSMETKNISGFLIQPVLRDVMKEQNSNPLQTSRNLYNEIKQSADFHLTLLKLFVKNHKESQC